MKIDLISLIDNEKEFCSTLEYFSEFNFNEHDDMITLSESSKLLTDFDYYSSFKLYFRHFKDFLLKYEGSKYEISY